MPHLLGYKNSNKALRRLDQFCNELADCDLLDRLRHSEIFAGNDLESVLTSARHQLQLQQAELRRQDEVRALLAFVPHLWVIHTNSVPSPIFVVGFFGLETFKRIPLPESLSTQKKPQNALLLVARFIEDYLAEPPIEQHVLNNCFGKAEQILYRDQYDHSFLYDIKLHSWIDEIVGVQNHGRVTLMQGRADITGIGSIGTIR